MQYVVSTFLLLAQPLFWHHPAWAAAQEPSGPTPVQPTRLLTLPTLQPPVADTGIFSAAPLPPANETRRADGAPGPEYWQQRVDYTIKAALDTATKRIDGTVAIRYTNNSPDTLRYVWMQLDQNLFKPGSTGSLLFAADSRYGGAGFKGGFEIERVTQCSGAAGQRGSGAAGQSGEGSDRGSLAIGGTAGTPAFMAPETVLGVADTDHRVDLYALGCVGYWLLTGRLIFEGRSGVEVMFHHAHTPPPRPSTRSELSIPGPLEDLIMECLEKDPARRPPSAEAVSTRLEAVLLETDWTIERAERWWAMHRPLPVDARRVAEVLLSQEGRELRIGPRVRPRR